MKRVCCKCNGTGIYTGWPCRGGAAIECNACSGEGGVPENSEFATKELFFSRGIIPTTTRVFLSGNYYSGVNGTPGDSIDGQPSEHHNYGVPYSDWLKGMKPKAIPPYLK